MPRNLGVKTRVIVVACICAGIFLACLTFLSGRFFCLGIGIGFDKGRNLLLMGNGPLTVHINGTLNVCLQLRNIGRSAITLEYPNSHVTDLLVYSFVGELVTYQSKGCGFLQVITHIRLQPGETKEWKLQWDHFGGNDLVCPGAYLLKSTILYLGTSSIPIFVLP